MFVSSNSVSRSVTANVGIWPWELVTSLNPDDPIVFGRWLVQVCPCWQHRALCRAPSPFHAACDFRRWSRQLVGRHCELLTNTNKQIWETVFISKEILSKELFLNFLRYSSVETRSREFFLNEAKHFITTSCFKVQNRLAFSTVTCLSTRLSQTAMLCPAAVITNYFCEITHIGISTICTQLGECFVCMGQAPGAFVALARQWYRRQNFTAWKEKQVNILHARHVELGYMHAHFEAWGKFDRTPSVHVHVYASMTKHAWTCIPVKAC